MSRRTYRVLWVVVLVVVAVAAIWVVDRRVMEQVGQRQEAQDRSLAAPNDGG